MKNQTLNADLANMIRGYHERNVTSLTFIILWPASSYSVCFFSESPSKHTNAHRKEKKKRKQKDSIPEE